MSNLLITCSHTHVSHHILAILPMLIHLYTNLNDSFIFGRSFQYKFEGTLWEVWCAVIRQKSKLVARQISQISQCETKSRSPTLHGNRFCSLDWENVAGYSGVAWSQPMQLILCSQVWNMSVGFSMSMNDRKCWAHCRALTVCSHPLGMFQHLTSVYSCLVH